MSAESIYRRLITMRIGGRTTIHSRTVVRKGIDHFAIRSPMSTGGWLQRTGRTAADILTAIAIIEK